ncbi:hypothetical protein CY34DRAFT_802499 [Suillus luteus UH-Slu-Lm8-n1]|uniref:Uncharacterized protein n=1 Tax=Suillus luteus UH-Slu-Lm8-n1 TaxID=930992 RepID=A0A0D0BN16_9AGAM|nr:hypothetical protein CY34DRAFT_802499 [Suillus luteus UH-Slu-Lm8-n1]
MSRSSDCPLEFDNDHSNASTRHVEMRSLAWTCVGVAIKSPLQEVTHSAFVAYTTWQWNFFSKFCSTNSRQMENLLLHSLRGR